jgi:hypothetical protein
MSGSAAKHNSWAFNPIARQDWLEKAHNLSNMNRQQRTGFQPNQGLPTDNNGADLSALIQDAFKCGQEPVDMGRRER